ncbi:MAG: LuxR family transcriptional regulator, partial [Chloroflexi bacterium]|nr:LuxR family transcriptional regulator [Chloroflexota bacterium]
MLLLDIFGDGVFWVSLVNVQNVAQLPTLCAVALGMPLQKDEPAFAQLLAYLHAKQLLLVLDNFEELLEAAGLLAQLLDAAPQLKLLVTSREPLH